MSLTSEEIKAIVEAVVDTLDQRRHMSNEEHEADHRLIKLMAEERAERAQLYRDMRASVVKWGLLGVIGAIVTMAWFYVTHALVMGKLP